HGRQAGDEELRAGLAQHALDVGRPGFHMVILDQGRGIEVVARHQNRSARSSSMMAWAMEPGISAVASSTSSSEMRSSPARAQYDSNSWSIIASSPGDSSPRRLASAASMTAPSERNRPLR